MLSALVGAYSKAGKWAEAEGVLRRAEAEAQAGGGGALPVHAYNTLIGALGRKG
jgi:pentatricopeptide repeat protein